jgi:hypothetical protein
VAKQGYLAPQDQWCRQLSCFSFCRSLYALALMFPPKLSSQQPPPSAGLGWWWQGRTPLHVAAFCGRTALIELLVELGAKLEARNPQQLTALHYAATAGQLPSVHALCRCGADLATRDQRGLTALYMAAVLGEPATIAALVPFHLFALQFKSLQSF